MNITTLTAIVPFVPAVMVVMVVTVVSYCQDPKRYTPSLDLPHFNLSENAMPAPSVTNCLRYWDLADHIQLADAIALWCGVEPAELAKLNFETQCMSAKRAALVTALRDGRLEYEDLGLVTNHGKVFKGAPIDELLEKGRLVINKTSLRRWFEQLPFEDRPEFLFDESRQPVLPDGSDVAEMNSLRAIAVMAHMLANTSPKYRHGDKPNSDAIGKAVLEMAEQVLGNSRSLASFHKKIADALCQYGPEIKVKRI